VHRFVCDIAAGELARARRSAAGLATPPWGEGLRLDRDLGADSLEVMSLAAALAESIHLHRAGIEDALLARRAVGQWIDVAQAGLEQFSAELTFRTSGSTGQPKPCVHALAALEEEARELAAAFTGRERILYAVPSHHIYGFIFTVLMPRELGLARDQLVDVRAGSPASLAAIVRPGDLVVAFPEYWRGLAQAVPRLPFGVVGVTSTAPCPDAVSAALERSGLEALVQVYGSSETAGVGWRKSHRDPYRLLSHWERQGDETLVRRVAGRRVEVRAPDMLDWIDARAFHVGMRRDAAVQVGGYNVHPHHVRGVLLGHPAVREAAVRLMRPDEGDRLKAFLVVDPSVAESGAFEAELREWIDARLSPPERPRALRFGRALPASATAKALDWDAD
jgi:4-coumarate--CoA ligase (photoactive yellow protein activation family)